MPNIELITTSAFREASRVARLGFQKRVTIKTDNGTTVFLEFGRIVQIVAIGALTVASQVGGAR